MLIAVIVIASLALLAWMWWEIATAPLGYERPEHGFVLGEEPDDPASDNFRPHPREVD